MAFSFDPDLALRAVRGEDLELGVRTSVSPGPPELQNETALPAELVSEPPASPSVLTSMPVGSMPPALGSLAPDELERPEAIPGGEPERDARFETVEDPRIPPEKMFFKIGEVAQITGVKPYVLRYWETEFPWLRPSKTSSKQRLYRRQDVALLFQIKRLRYEENETIATAKQQIRRARGHDKDGPRKIDDKKREEGRRSLRPPKSRRPGPRDDVAAEIPLLGTIRPGAEGGLDPASTQRVLAMLADMKRTVLDLLETVE